MFPTGQRVQAERTREPHVAAHRPVPSLASSLARSHRASDDVAACLAMQAAQRNRWLKTFRSQNDCMRPFEDIDTTGGPQDISKNETRQKHAGTESDTHASYGQVFLVKDSITSVNRIPRLILWMEARQSWRPGCISKGSPTQREALYKDICI